MSPRSRPGPVKAAPAGGCAGLDRPWLTGVATPFARIVVGDWHNGTVRKSAIENETSTSELSEDELVARIAADRKAGKDTTKDVERLLHLGGEKNRAALDRLAQ